MRDVRVRRGYKVELDLNNEQRTACLKHAGCSRFAWNWGLKQKQEARAAGQKMPTAMELQKRLNALKPRDYPWMYECSKCAPQEALRNLDDAYKHAYRRWKEGKRGKGVGWPKLKKRSQGIGSFRLTGSLHVFEKAIHLPRLGLLRLKEHGYLPVGAKVAQATVSEQAGRWYISIQVETEQPDPIAAQGPVIGVDLGIKTLAVVSDGRVIANPSPLRKNLKKLRRLSRWLSRKKKSSANRRKAKAKLATHHARIAHIREDALHQATSSLVAKTTPPERRPSVIGIEDLGVSGMLKNHRLSRAIADVGMYEFRRQLIYKAEFAGVHLHVVSRWEPSSKTCSHCGWYNVDLELADRVFVCQECGLVIDRDFNAARNLQLLAYLELDSTASYAGIDACGMGGSGSLGNHRVKLPTTKQEPNAAYGVSING